MKKAIINCETGEITEAPLTTEEIAAFEAWAVEEKPAFFQAELRRIRNEKLAETDWMANSDVTMSDEWRAYRQALRDLPANTTDPANPVWPTKPE